MSRFYIIIFIIISLILISNTAKSQDLRAIVKTADKAFDQGNYYGASLLYAKVVKMSPSLHKVQYRLAESYRLDNDYSNAMRVYRRIVLAYVDKYPLAMYYYAQMLKSNEDYLLAQYYFNEFLTIENIQFEEFYVKSAKREILACEKAQL